MDYGRWSHTALLCSLLAEPHRDYKRRPKPYTVHDFHPWERKPKPRVITGAELVDIGKDLARQFNRGSRA